MKKQFIKVLSLCAMFAVSATMFTSCDKDDDDAKPEDVVDTKDPEPEQNVVKQIYFLYEGQMDLNNSTLGCYYPNGEHEYQSKVFASVNGEALGDTGQDIIVYGNRIYLSVFGSNYLAKLDLNGKVIEKYTFSEAEGQPRYLEAKDGNVYVSLYSGNVAKFDTTSIKEIKGTVAVGTHPEEMTILDDKLYVAIAGDYNVAYENKLAVVNLSNFTSEGSFEVGEDPTNVLALNNDLFVIHYNTTTWAQEMLIVNPTAKTSELFMANVSKMATDGKDLFYVESTTDWATHSTTNTFYKKGADGKGVEFLNTTETPEILSAGVYLLEIDPENGDFYIGITDYKTSSTIYRFDKNGKFVTKFESTTPSPNHAAFIY